MCCQFHVDEETEAILSQKYNTGVRLEKGLIKPSAKASIITGEGITTMRWGFPSPKTNGLLINARRETVETKPSFRDSFTTSRCIIATSLFYEYDRYKMKVGFTLPTSPILFMAGIYTNGDGELRFTVLTTEANASVSPFHDRMPLLLSDRQLDSYLYDKKEASELLRAPMPTLNAHSENVQLEFAF